MRTDVIFFDLATTTGWCRGAPGARPVYGSHRMAPVGSDPAAIFGAAIGFFVEQLQTFPPRAVWYEAPIMSAMAGKSNPATARVLTGLPAVLEGVSYRLGLYGVKHVAVSTIRKHFLGNGRIPSAEAKRQVIDRCLALGLSPQDDNAADAIAGWDYACAIVDPKAHACGSTSFVLRP